MGSLELRPVESPAPVVATQRAGVDLAFRYPIGIGPGQFEALEPRSAHSTYVRVLAEQGIVVRGHDIARVVRLATSKDVTWTE